MAGDPIYRYDFAILTLKIMLAGVGCAVLIGALPGGGFIIPTRVAGNRLLQPARQQPGDHRAEDRR